MTEIIHIGAEFRGEIICTHATRALLIPMLRDVMSFSQETWAASGRNILEGRTPSRAAIHHLTGYSAHADQGALLAWIASMPEPPAEIRLVHGTPEAKKALEEKLSATAEQTTIISQ